MISTRDIGEVMPDRKRTQEFHLVTNENKNILHFYYIGCIVLLSEIR